MHHQHYKIVQSIPLTDTAIKIGIPYDICRVASIMMIVRLIVILMTPDKNEAAPITEYVPTEIARGPVEAT